jgi:hypothetical protein
VERWAAGGWGRVWRAVMPGPLNRRVRVPASRMSGKSVPSVTAQWRMTFLMACATDSRRAVARRCAEGRQVGNGVRRRGSGVVVAVQRTIASLPASRSEAGWRAESRDDIGSRSGAPASAAAMSEAHAPGRASETANASLEGAVRREAATRLAGLLLPTVLVVGLLGQAPPTRGCGGTSGCWRRRPPYCTGELSRQQ